MLGEFNLLGSWNLLGEWEEIPPTPPRVIKVDPYQAVIISSGVDPYAVIILP